MSEITKQPEIVPITRLELGEMVDLGVALHAQVKRSYVAEHLRSRHILGVITRHAESEDESRRAINKARDQHHRGNLGIFVVRGYNAQPLGLATVDPEASVRRLRSIRDLRLPPILSRGPAAETIATHGPQVTAWIAPGQGQEGLVALTAAYRELGETQGIAQSFYDGDAQSAWALEPKASPDWVRSAITAGGFRRVGSGYFDDNEHRLIAPPIADLYEVPNQAAPVVDKQ